MRILTKHARAYFIYIFTDVGLPIALPGLKIVYKGIR